MKIQTFEDYLEEIAGESLMDEGVLDDDLPDGANDWIANLDVQEVIDYAEKWGENVKEAREKEIVDWAKEKHDGLKENIAKDKQVAWNQGNLNALYDLEIYIRNIK